jgi:hypothetical protein
VFYRIRFNGKQLNFRVRSDGRSPWKRKPSSEPSTSKGEMRNGVGGRDEHGHDDLIE